MATLSVELTANIRRLENELKKAKKELFELEEASESVNRQGTRSFNRFGKGVANTTPTLLEFNRVIQDAPFGIQGVANNLTQLTQNFGQLSQQAGGTRAALRLLLSGLSGPAGILFAVSAITSLLVTFGDRLKSTANEAKTLDDRLQELSETANRDLNINQLQLDILKLQGKEFGSILLQRKQILATQLSTLSNLLEEEQATLKIAKADAGRLTTLEALDRVSQDLIVKQAAIALFLAKTTAQEVLGPYAELFGLLSEGITVTQDGVKATASETAKITESEARIKQLQEERLKLLREIAQLTNDISETNRTAIRAENVLGSGFPELVNVVQSVEAQIANNLGTLPNRLAPAYNALQQQAIDFNNRMADIFSAQNVASAIQGFGQIIGQSLAQGQSLIQGIGNGLIGTFGRFLSQMGQLLIEYGSLAVVKGKLDLAIATGGPVSIGAGLAAIAVGTALTAAGAALSNRAGQGFGQGVGGQGSVGFRGSTSFSSSAGSFSDGTVVFEIEGQKLVGVLNRTLGRNARLGGTQSLS